MPRRVTLERVMPHQSFAEASSVAAFQPSIRCIRGRCYPLFVGYIKEISHKGQAIFRGISRNVHRLLSVRRCRIQLEDKALLAKLQKTARDPAIHERRYGRFHYLIPFSIFFLSSLLPLSYFLMLLLLRLFFILRPHLVSIFLYFSRRFPSFAVTPSTQ